MREKRLDRQLLLLCFAAAAISLAFCSKCSFFYPINDSMDANCFFTVGKGMFNGLVPYRDLYEQKGPLVYFLHGLAWMISNRSFIAVYLLEVIAGTLFLFYCSRIAGLFVGHKAQLCAAPICAALSYASVSFSHGDTVEELSLGLVALSLYMLLSSIKTGKLIGWKQVLISGLSAGAVLMSKYSMLGFFFVWMAWVFFATLRRKEYLKAFAFCLLYLGAMALVSLPFVIYFAANDALDDFWQVYFYNNIFLYSGAKAFKPLAFLQGIPILHSLAMFAFSMAAFLIKNIQYTLPTGLAILYLCIKKEHRKLGLASLLLYAGLCMGVFYGGNLIDYYGLITAAFLPLAFALLRERRWLRPVPAAAAALCFCLAFNGNWYLFMKDKSEVPQWQFAYVLEQDPEASLLNYNVLDLGVYTCSGLIPQEKYFCRLNIPLEELMEEQESCLREKRAKYIVLRDNITQLAEENYELISEAQQFYEGDMHNYILMMAK